MLANGELYALIFFGGLIVLALAGTVQVDRRKACLEGNIWRAYAAKSSHIPFAAILAKRTHFSAREIGWLPVILGIILYLVLLILYETVIAIAPISCQACLIKPSEGARYGALKRQILRLK